MIINPQSGSSGIKLLAHNIVTIPTNNTPVTVSVPTALFVLMALTDYRGHIYGCVGLRGGCVGDNVSAILSANGSELTLINATAGNVEASAEYWAFG